MDLTPDVIFSLLQSSDPFPVDFDDAMNWWDCRTKNGELVRKSDLKEKLVFNFDEHRDYIFAENSAKNDRGRNRDIIKLSLDCFKMMGMMVSGERGFAFNLVGSICLYFVCIISELINYLRSDKPRSL